jgi:alkyl hydroperoxide reductase subunit AhpC
MYMQNDHAQRGQDRRLAETRGLVVVEGFHRDLRRPGLAGAIGHHTNELLRAFDHLRILHYADTVGPADWERSGQQAPIVRFLAVREQ